jgi:DNA-binding beta-propeller fold protein YncE
MRRPIARALVLSLVACASAPVMPSSASSLLQSVSSSHLAYFWTTPGLSSTIYALDETSDKLAGSLSLPNDLIEQVIASPATHRAYALVSTPTEMGVFINHVSVDVLAGTTVAAQIPVVSEYVNALGIAVDQSGKFAYVLTNQQISGTNPNAGTFYVVDIAAQRVVASYGTGWNVGAGSIVAADQPGQPYVYVAWSNERTGTIGVLNTTTNRFESFIQAQYGHLSTLALNSAGTRLYAVGNPYSSQPNTTSALMIFDTTSKRQIGSTVVVGASPSQRPTYPSVSPDGTIVFVSSAYQYSNGAMTAVSYVDGTTGKYVTWFDGNFLDLTGATFCYDGTRAYAPGENSINVISPVTRQIVKVISIPRTELIGWGNNAY